MSKTTILFASLIAVIFAVASTTGCTPGLKRTVGGVEFEVIYMDLWRAPTIRVLPRFEWTKSMYKTTSPIERVKVLTEIAKEALNKDYCKKKNAVFADFKIISELPTIGSDVKDEELPKGLEASFVCKPY